MSAERRERYAAAIGAEGVHNVHVTRMAANAAMAVADAEAAELREEIDTYRRQSDAHYRVLADEQAENARLCGEVTRSKHDMARIRGNIANGGISDAALIRSIKEIAGEGPTA